LIGQSLFQPKNTNLTCPLVKRANLVRNEAEDERLVGALALEGAKEPVPHDEQAAKVGVQAVLVAAVVHAVVRRGVEERVQRPEARRRHPRVHAELVEHVERHVHQVHLRRHHQALGQVEEHGHVLLHQALPGKRGKIIHLLFSKIYFYS